MICGFFAQQIATAIDLLSTLKPLLEAYLTRKALTETLSQKQLEFSDKAYQSIKQSLADLQALKEALK